MAAPVLGSLYEGSCDFGCVLGAPEFWKLPDLCGADFRTLQEIECRTWESGPPEAEGSALSREKSG